MKTPRPLLTAALAAILSSNGAIALAQVSNDHIDHDQATSEADAVNAVLRTATIYVRDWDASLEFYTGYLGYSVRVEADITSEKSLNVIGAKPGMTARIAYLTPSYDRIKRPFAGNSIGLIEFVGGDLDNSFDRPEGDVSAIRGEIVFSHQVAGIEQIYAAMLADGIQIVVPLSPSGSGLSQSFAAIDPNGIRVEMYEYFEGNEPTE